MKRKTIIIATLSALAAAVLVLSSCANNTPETDKDNRDTSGVTDEVKTPLLSDKITPALAAAPEFKAGGTLKDVRVYFDNSVIDEKVQKTFTSDETVIGYMNEHGIEHNQYLWLDIFAEEIKSEITSVLDSHGIKIEEDKMQFGTSSAYLTFSEIGYDDLISLSQDKNVTKIAALHEDNMISLSESVLKKVSNEDGFETLLGEAMTDDVFNVEISFNFLSRSEIDNPLYSIESAEEYAEQLLGYTYEDIERLAEQAMIIDEEHGKRIFNPTEEQAAKITEMQDAYRHAKAEHFFANILPYTPTEEEEALIQKRFTEFLANNNITVGDAVKRNEYTLSGEMSASEIVRLLETAEVGYVWIEEPFIKIPEYEGSKLFHFGNCI